MEKLKKDHEWDGRWSNGGAKVEEGDAPVTFSNVCSSEWEKVASKVMGPDGKTPLKPAQYIVHDQATWDKFVALEAADKEQVDAELNAFRLLGEAEREAELARRIKVKKEEEKARRGAAATK